MFGRRSGGREEPGRVRHDRRSQRQPTELSSRVPVEGSRAVIPDGAGMFGRTRAREAGVRRRNGVRWRPRRDLDDQG